MVYKPFVLPSFSPSPSNEQAKHTVYPTTQHTQNSLTSLKAEKNKWAVLHALMIKRYWLFHTKVGKRQGQEMLTENVPLFFN